MDISSYTPMSCQAIQDILKDAQPKMDDYCRYRSIEVIMEKYNKYKKGIFIFSRRKSLLEWCIIETNDWNMTSKNIRKYAFTFNYDGFITQTLRNTKHSSNGLMYMSNEDMDYLNSIQVRTTSKEILEDIAKAKKENPELWDLMVKERIP